MGENIADNGGLREAFHAYQLYKDSFGSEPKLPGFEDYTHEQLLFISFGNVGQRTADRLVLKPNFISLQNSYSCGVKLKQCLRFDGLNRILIVQDG